MNIRRRILIPMITLTIVACVAVFIAAIVLFIGELNNAMRDKIDIAADVVEKEIQDLMVRAEVAAIGMANNPELIDVLENNDREGIIYMANSLKSMTQIDFCNIVDTEGFVITRTHEPTVFGDNISNQPHVRKAMDGQRSSNITQGAVITLGAYAGSPVYDNDMEMIGIISLGYRLDIQEFAHRMKNLTGCEITVYRNNERISSTILDADGSYTLGTEISEEISDIVLSGQVYYGNINLFGDNVLAHYSPIYGFDNSVVGIVFVGFYTAEDMNKITMFIMVGALITLAVLGVCLTIARFVTGFIERRLEGMMDELRETQEDLREARDTAETASEAKSSFLANMSHEIRTPMNSIIGFTELAQDDEISLKTRDYLVNIQDSALWLLSIINDILDISKIESGKIDLERIPFSLPDIFDHCQSAILQKTAEKGIMLYCYAEPSVGKKLLGDPVRLRQVIMNLLSNAVKFTNSGTVKLLASLGETDENHTTIHFEIKDSGIGMTQDQIERIFDPFKQADDSITRNYGGTGLGLTITKNIIDLMGGTLHVESAPGIGSKFSFEIKFDLVDDLSENMSEKIIINDFKKPNFKGEVLICEDNTLNQNVICDHLSRVGLKTIVADNGKDGVDVIEERIRNNMAPFDLIFMDIHMPVMDGLEAAARITELGVKTPIIALTANIMSNDLELYKISGMSDTIGKPFTAQELWRCLVKFIPVEKYTVINQKRQAVEEQKILMLLKTNFVRNNQTTLEEFIACLNNNEIKTAHRIAHTLKSNAGQIDEKRLHLTAAFTEAMLADGTNRLQDEHIINLETELNAVLAGLAPLLSSKRLVIDSTLYDRKSAIELIAELEPMLRNNDMECLRFTDKIAATIPGSEELIEYIDDCEFSRAIISLEGIKKAIISEDSL